MPLPPTLAARLAKRGLVTKGEEASKPPPKHHKPAASVCEEVEEEVFAEDYDEPSLPSSAHGSESKPEHEEEEDGTYGSIPTTTTTSNKPLVHETVACPNKTNPYHKCVHCCQTRWGYKQFDADQHMERQRHRMLRKYPLPENWVEVADPDTGRYYYWNMQTEEVSWLAPLHPKAQISVSAEQLQRLLPGSTVVSEGEEEEEEEREKEEQIEEESDDDDDDIDDLEGMENTWKEVLSERWEKEIRQARQLEKDRRKEERKDSRKGRKREELDPMDPAAYSDVPRGSWTTGLDMRGSAKTGVDVTASGPLFQQRPYPSPGAILRMNKQIPEPGDD